MKLEKSRSYLGVDILKHGLAICVVIQHMRFSMYDVSTISLITQLTNYLQGAVLTFFLVSGYFFHVKRKDGRFNRPLIAYLGHQAQRLLLPFAVFSLINAVVMLHFGITSVRKEILNFLMGFGTGPQMYFLPFLFVCTGIGAIIQTASRPSRRREAAIFLMLAVLLTVVALYLPTGGATGENYRLLPLYGVAFIGGHLISLMQQENYAKGMFTTIGLATIFSALGFVDFRFYYIGVGVIVFAVAYIMSSILPDRRGPGSGGVYLLHAPIISFAVVHGLARLGIKNGMNVALSVFLIYVLCLSITLVLIKVSPHYRMLLLE